MRLRHGRSAQCSACLRVARGLMQRIGACPRRMRSKGPPTSRVFHEGGVAKVRVKVRKSSSRALISSGRWRSWRGAQRAGARCFRGRGRSTLAGAWSAVGGCHGVIAGVIYGLERRLVAEEGRTARKGAKQGRRSDDLVRDREPLQAVLGAARGDQVAIACARSGLRG